MPIFPNQELGDSPSILRKTSFMGSSLQGITSDFETLLKRLKTLTTHYNEVCNYTLKNLSLLDDFFSDKSFIPKAILQEIDDWLLVKHGITVEHNLTTLLSFSSDQGRLIVKLVLKT